VTQDGLYEFNVLAQDLMNAPPTFQRVMNNLIATGRWNYVVVYLDDILIFSDTIMDHKKHVAELLSILQKAMPRSKKQTYDLVRSDEIVQKFLVHAVLDQIVL
jgi:hypothetical protein